MTENTVFDVAVVGFGPAGALATALLGRAGLRVLAIDQSREIYDRPRAIAIDHEILRHLDNIGLAEQVMPFIEPFTTSEHFGAQGQMIRRISMVPKPWPMGYCPSMVFSQPPFEAVLRQAAAGSGAVDLRLGTQLAGFAQDGDGVTLDLIDDHAQATNARALWLLGCDGASSTVRRLAGIALEDLVFDEPWLVVDVLLDPASLAKVPPRSAQFCDPARPISYVIGPGQHRRWEIMLLPGEDPVKMQQPDQVWQLLSRWITPQDGSLWRAAAYRFHALVADRWAIDRVFVAGDAAHQQPPFIGQGMCQGLRDVTNLAWKLIAHQQGRAPRALLDSYEQERKAHVIELTSRIKHIGEMICLRDPVAAAERDARILAEGGGKPPEITRQEIVPPLRTGHLSDGAGVGTLFPQPGIVTVNGRQLLDQITGSGWRIVIDGRLAGDAMRDAAVQAVAGILAAVAVIGGTGLAETDGVLAAWFDRLGVSAAIVRPDHYVFATADNPAKLLQAIKKL